MVEIRTPWRNVAAAFALNGVFLGCWASRIPAFVDRLALDERTLGGLLLVMGLGALVSFPLAGRLSDAFGAVRVTRGIAVAYLVSVLLVASAPSIGWMAAALLIFGMCHGSMDVTMNSWASEVERHMGRSVMSSFHAMWSLGAGLGAVTGFVATSLGAAPLLHYALVAAGVALLFGPFLMAPWQSDTREKPQDAPVFALPRGALVLVGLMALSAGLGEGAVADWSAIFLKEVLNRPEAQATLGYGVFSVTMVAMRLAVDGLVTRHGPVRVARISGLLAAAGYALCATATVLPLALLGFVLMGLGCAAVVPMAFTRAANDPDVPAGQAIASVATLCYGALLLGPPIVGFIAHATNLRLPFMLIGCATLMVAIFAPALAPAQGGAPKGQPTPERG